MQLFKKNLAKYPLKDLRKPVICLINSYSKMQQGAIVREKLTKQYLYSLQSP